MENAAAHDCGYAASTGASTEPADRPEIHPGRAAPFVPPGQKRSNIPQATIAPASKPVSRITIASHNAANPADNKTEANDWISIYQNG